MRSLLMISALVVVVGGPSFGANVWAAGGGAQSASKWQVWRAKGTRSLGKLSRVARKLSRPSSWGRALTIGVLAAGLAVSGCSIHVPVRNAPLPPDAKGIVIPSEKLPGFLKDPLHRASDSAPAISQKAHEAAKKATEAQRAAEKQYGPGVTVHWEGEVTKTSGKGTPADPLEIDLNVRHVITVPPGHPAATSSP